MTVLKPGQLFGPYEIIRELGHGGMAVVYQARQPSLDRTVALKVLAPELARDPDFVARFHREATIAAKLDHPSVVAIHDVGHHDGVFFIAMRCVPGSSLADQLADHGPLPLERVHTILTQIAGALDYAHERGVVHRDLKPGNILIESGDRASLADFGIARAGDSSRHTRTGTIAGTPEYMAPEQVQGMSVDARADLYALGIIAYEMLGGRVPFQADSAIAVLHKQIYEPAPPLRTVRPDLPDYVERAIQRMLSKRADDRFESAMSFVAALGGAVGLPTPRPVTAPPVGPGRRSRPPSYASRPPVASSGTRRWLLPASIAGAAALAVMTAVALAALTRPAPATPLAAATTAPVADQNLVPLNTPAPTATVPPPTAPPVQATVTPLPTIVPTATATSIPVPAELGDVALDPPRVSPGDSFTMTYELSNANPIPVEAVLGASIKPPDNGPVIDDSSNDLRVTVQPGKRSYRRVFRVPHGVIGGQYEVWWGLIATDMKTRLGLQQVANALTVVVPAAPTVAARAPAPPAPQPSRLPAESVRNYYVFLGSKNFAAARELQSPRLQRTLDYQRWADGYATTRSITVESVTTTSQTGDTAVVDVIVGAVDFIDGQNVSRRWRGTWSMVLVGNAWKLDNGSLKAI